MNVAGYEMIFMIDGRIIIYYERPRFWLDGMQPIRTIYTICVYLPDQIFVIRSGKTKGQRYSYRMKQVKCKVIYGYFLS